MRVCPSCGTMYQNGEICGRCGTYLVAASQDLSQDPYGGYDSSYGGSSYTTNSYSQDLYSQSSQSSYPSSSYSSSSYQGASANSQSAPAPTPTAPSAAPSYTLPTAYPASMPNYPIVPTVKKRTGLIVFLLFLIALLIGGLVYLLVFRGVLDDILNPEPEQSGPTQLENSVATSAWNWYAGIDKAITDSGLLDLSASDLDDQAMHALSASESAESAILNEEPGAEALDGQASAADLSTQTPDATTDDSAQAALQDLETLSDQSSVSMEALLMLSFMVDEDMVDEVDAPMQTMSEDYPEVVSSWDELRDSLLSLSDQNEESASKTSNVQGAGTSDSSSASSTNTVNVASESDSSAANASTDDLSDAQNATAGGQTPDSAIQDEENAFSRLKEIYENIKTAAQNFKRAAQSAGFNTSSWN